MFERIITKQPMNNAGVTFYKQNQLNNNFIIKEIVQKHKNLLSLNDNKAKMENIKEILQYHNISIQPSMKLAALKDLLLQHCNTAPTVPVTFVSDCSIENYTVAAKKDISSNQQLTDFVPVTFIHDSMINLVKTGEMENDSGKAVSKRIDLTPVKHGYMPERHPTKKQKANKSMKNLRATEISSSSDEELSMHQPKVKSFKEMVNALHKSTISSSDSDDDFNQDFQLLDNSDLFFSKLDEPSENEKKIMQGKSYMSASFDNSHDFQMVKTTELWEYKEFDRSMTPKSGNNGFEEPLIISCDLNTGKAYVTEGNHRLWVAIREGIPFVPCRVIPHWLPPNGLCKKIDMDLTTLQSKEIILPEHLGLTVATR